MKTKEELLEELCRSQYKTLRFLNKIMFEETKRQRELPENKRNHDLLELVWGANDIITDHPNEEELLKLLYEEYGLIFK